jgi:hypothetical protein
MYGFGTGFKYLSCVLNFRQSLGGDVDFFYQKYTFRVDRPK